MRDCREAAHEAWLGDPWLVTVPGAVALPGPDRRATLGPARAGLWAQTAGADGPGASRPLGARYRACWARLAGAGGPLAICSS